MIIAKMQGKIKVVNNQPTLPESKREFTPKLIETTTTAIEDPKIKPVLEVTNDLVNFAFQSDVDLA